MKILMMVLLAILLYGDDWKLVKESGGVNVSTRVVEGSKYLEFRGETVVDATIGTVVAVLYDTASCSEWLYECSYGLTLDEVSFEENYIYEVYDLAFPVSDRGVILHAELKWGETWVTLTTGEVQDFCNTRSDIRCEQVKKRDAYPITRSRGEYRLRMLDKRRTEVVWVQHTEPGGSVPTWLVNSMVVDLPFETLTQLKKIVKKERYRGMTRMKLRSQWQKEYDLHH